MAINFKLDVDTLEALLYVSKLYSFVSNYKNYYIQLGVSFLYLSIFQYSKPLRMRIISWGQQNIHVANPKKKLIIINYLKLR
jgi:hypothetical protein